MNRKRRRRAYSIRPRCNLGVRNAAIGEQLNPGGHSISGWMGRKPDGEIVESRQEGMNKLGFQPQTTPAGTALLLSDTNPAKQFAKGELAWWFDHHDAVIDGSRAGYNLAKMM